MPAICLINPVSRDSIAKVFERGNIFLCDIFLGVVFWEGLTARNTSFSG